jgi:hypothetical protein
MALAPLSLDLAKSRWRALETDGWSHGLTHKAMPLRDVTSAETDCSGAELAAVRERHLCRG